MYLFIYKYPIRLDIYSAITDTCQSQLSDCCENRFKEAKCYLEIGTFNNFEKKSQFDQVENTHACIHREL